ncbi:MAG: cyclic nucleotide-binding domain-containing protein [Mycobacteriales bacterium]
MSLLARKHSYDKLVDVPFFAGWTKDELGAVDRVADWVDYAPLEHLIQQGATGYEFIVILEGQVEVVVDGHVVASLGPGDHVGEMALLDGSPRNASVIATTPVRALLVGSREFRALVAQVPSLDRKLLLSLTARLRQAVPAEQPARASRAPAAGRGTPAGASRPSR